MSSAIKTAQALNKFVKSNKLTLSKVSLKHDLIHAVNGLGVTLQDEVTVFCLQKGYLISEEKANKVAAELAKFNHLTNDFSYSLLVETYSTYKVDHLTEELVAQVAIILNVK